MTVAVLFISANPLTNSHIAILRSAVEHLNADKGLFVATNGEYLKRKIVKRGGGFTPEGEAIMLNKIRTIYRIGIEHGNDALVAGALSCGAYKCPPQEVARLFRVVMEESEFKNKFRLIVFAILEKTRSPHGLDGKYALFYREFGTYVL